MVSQTHAQVVWGRIVEEELFCGLITQPAMTGLTFLRHGSFLVKKLNIFF